MLDNNYLLLLKVRENLPILVAGSEDDTFFIQHALAPSDKAPVTAKRIDPNLLASETLDNYPCIFLVNALPLPGQAIAALEDYVRRGRRGRHLPRRPREAGGLQRPSVPSRARPAAGG